MMPVEVKYPINLNRLPALTGFIIPCLMKPVKFYLARLIKFQTLNSSYLF